MDDLTPEQFSSKIAAILDEIKEGKLDDNDYDKIIEYRDLLNPFGRIIEGSDHFLSFSYINMSENYMKKVITTAMIGYLNRACDEWHVPEGIPVIPVYDYIQNPELLNEYHKNWTITDKYKKDIEENAAYMEKRVIIKQFLEEMFQFNPDEHLRSAYRPQFKDLERKIITTPAANLAVKCLSKKDKEFREQVIEYNRICNLMTMSKTTENNKSFTIPALNTVQLKKLILSERENDIIDFSSWSEKDKNLMRTVCEMIPPADTFYKFNNYMESNYDKIREAVNHLYCEKSDFDISFCPHQWHDTEEEAIRYQNKHRDELSAAIFTARSGTWGLLAPFEKQRQAERFFGKDTTILEEMQKKNEQDLKIAKELMKHKVAKKKKKNIEEEGEFAEAFKKYKAQSTTLRDMGAITLDDSDDDCPDDAIQCDVIRISDGGLNLTKDKFYSKSFPPEIIE